MCLIFNADWFVCLPTLISYRLMAASQISKLFWHIRKPKTISTYVLPLFILFTYWNKTFRNEHLDHLCTITSQCDQMAILFSTFGRLHEWKFSQWHTKFTKVVPKFCQKVNTPLKKSPKTVKILPSGEISPNLVTLLLANNLKS